MTKVLHYIIRFLMGNDIPEGLIATIGYTNDRRLFDRYSIVIIPSGFFEEKVYGHSSSLPELPLQEIEGIPFLYGSPEIEYLNDTCVIHADLIASTYFLITRYEEMVRRNVRDTHGRFPGKESLPYRAGFLERPIIDEYRKLLRKRIQVPFPRIPEIPSGLSNIYLTHDVDSPTLYRSWKGVIRSMLDGRNIWHAVKGRFGHPDKDPYYTFPWFFRQDCSLQEIKGHECCHSILFFRAGGRCKQDKPHYNLQSKDIQKLIKDCIRHRAHIGLHSSYQAGKKPMLITKEKQRLERNAGKPVRFNRHHFLANREPEDMDYLEACGITDDFTIGFADVAGFRLGTSYPVRWINPVTRRLSPLKLHPLTIMDCTLSEPQYMDLSYNGALAYVLQLIEQVENVNGELVLLWHNDTVATHTQKPVSVDWQKTLYTNILEYLKTNKK